MVGGHLQDLIDTRLQLHHAAQLANAAAMSYLSAQPDDSHTNLEWLARQQALAAVPVTGNRTIRVAVQVVPFELIVIEDEKVVDHFPLNGKRRIDAEQWLRAQVRTAGLDPARFTTKKHYEIPDHPVAHGANFDAPERDLKLCASLWSASDAAFRAFAAQRTGASAVRCWPHHFDLATLVALDPAATRTIGVGFSLGDDSYSQPYFYIGPYPRPSIEALPPLTIGHWHTNGWVGVVLTAFEWQLESQSESEQPRLLESFIQSGFEAARRVLPGA